jgi:SOS-response transcriptional repressor LexA
MSPEFSENCIIIVDPSIPIHNEAYVIVDFNDELYFRQYIEESGRKFLRCLNSSYYEIELNNSFEVLGCITQQKQRKQKPLHYYLPNEFTREIEFRPMGREKT